MTVNISGTFKKDERDHNGLEAIHDTLVKDPLTRHVVVGLIETTRIVRDVADGGTETPTVRFIRIEVLDGDAAEAARELLDEAYKGRTGATPPPDSLFDHGPEAAYDDRDDGDVPLDET